MTREEVSEVFERLRTHLTPEELHGGLSLADPYYDEKWGFDGGALEAVYAFPDEPAVTREVIDGIIFYISRWDFCDGQKRLSIGSLRDIAWGIKEPS